MAKAKKVTARKSPVKKSTVKRVRKAKLESFKVGRETAPFISFRVTDQTIYWSVLAIVILVLALWVLNIQMNISDILDKIQTL